MPPNENKPKVDDTTPVNKRIYLGGLHSSITEDQIKERFSRFGTISHIHVARDSENLCRGFAHMNIDTIPKKWAQCLSVYKGSKWKGQEIKIEEAKMDYKEREALRRQKIEEQEEKKKKRLLRWNDSEGFHAKDMSLVTDNNMNPKRGWKRGRYGRAILQMKLTKSDGTKFVFDPTHYKNNLTKLYNIGVPMKPVTKLLSNVNEDEEEDEDEDDHWPSLPAEEHREELENTVDSVDTRLLDDEKRRSAMEKRSEEQRLKKELISKSLAGELDDQSNYIKFDATEEIAKEEQDDEEEKAPLDGKKWLFDSSDDDEDEGNEDIDIKINPVLEGEAGRKRLELQSRFKGDDRFKLSADFIEEDEKEKNADLGDDISQGLHAEKDQAMDVLRFMFGEEKVAVKPTANSNMWTNAARFDPDAEDSYKYLTVSKTDDAPNSIENNEDTEMEEAEEEEEEDDLFDTPRKPESAAPEISKEKHFEVNTNLKPLFGDSDGTFKLFGSFNDDGEDKQEEPISLDSSSEINTSASLPSKSSPSSLGLGMMFFFHFDDPSLIKKSCYSYDPEGIFQSKPEEQDSYEMKWREQRAVIKEVLKKRQKQALRSQKKRITRDLK
ncbi:hypothetical protein G6F44_000864 [Rhizopus delemar]|nr:hypothetical protein G6F44_000864 [Rhizopus delemar]